MPFSERAAKSNKVIEILQKYYWDSPEIKKLGIFHEPYGYETHISQDTQNILKQIYTKTAKHIRFTPDYIIGRINFNLEPVVLLEYKVTTTPRFSLNDKQWNEGQIEADAWDNYINLINAGIGVAILLYCPYHPRPLLCDFPNNKYITKARNNVRQTMNGSGTPYCNIDLSAMGNFDDFMLRNLAFKKILPTIY